MALALNASNFNVDGQGKVTFTGMASGINAQQAVDSIMKARSVKVDSLNARVDTNTSKVKALDEFKAKVKTLNTSVTNLYGKMTADSSFDAFARKTVTSSARRVGDGSVVASPASDLATISADNRAAVGTHTVEVLQTARGEKIRSAAVSDTTLALGLSGSFVVGAQTQLARYSTDALAGVSWGTDQISITIGSGASAHTFSQSASNAAVLEAAFNQSAAASGSGFQLSLTPSGFVLVGPTGTSEQVPVSVGVVGGAAFRPIETTPSDAGVKVEVSASDSLQDIRNKINNVASASQTPSVSASILAVRPGENYLVLGANEAAGDLRFSEVSSSLRLASSLNLFALPSSRAIDVADPTQVTSLSVTIARPGVDQVVGANISVAGAADGYALASRLQSTLRAMDGGRRDITVAFDGASSKLTITDARGGAVTTLTSVPVASAGAAMASARLPEVIQQGQRLKVNLDGQLVERNTNSVSDLLTGVTLSCYKAEVGTEITIGVERDSAGVQAEIMGFLNSYNDIAEFIKKQTAYDPSTGVPSADAVLARSSVVRSLNEWFQSNLRVSAYGSSGGTVVKTLGDMGITIDQDPSSPTKGEILVDQAKLTKVIQSDPNAVRQVFAMVPTTGSGRLSVVGFNKDTALGSGGNYRFAFTPAAGATPAAGTFLENNTPQSIVKNGDVFTVTSGSAKGLVLMMTGGEALDTSVVLGNGIGSRVFGRMTSLLAADTGDIDVERKSIGDSSSAIQGRITALKERMARERENLLARFTRMESALSKMNSVKQQITSIVNAMTSKQSG
jgi:flagellar hook-associated protein 2